ncbi:MAG: hypothetical protein AMS15_05605 [Planctomycetes bacterium DG_23]|nr:MAG: hypothetical protein AMS15_05605 [Planctomycetes bacterium DG_23]
MLFFAVLSVLFLTGALRAEEDVRALVPEKDALAGWPMIDEVRVFQGEELFDFINGAGEPFYTYGFLSVATADYQNEDGQILTVEIYEMDSSANAFGIYSFQRPGQGERIEVGADCVLAESILYCWKDRYYIKVHTFPDSAAARDAVKAFAEIIAGNIKGKGEPPALLKALPPEGLIPGSEKFLHQKKILDNIRFLSRENVLRLSEKTNMLLADYKSDAGKITLFVVEYPDAEECELASESYGKFTGTAAARELKPGHRIISDKFIISTWGEPYFRAFELTIFAAANIEKFLREKKK